MQQPHGGDQQGRPRSSKPPHARPAAGLRSQRVSCNTFWLPDKWRWYNIYNPAGAMVSALHRIRIRIASS